MHYYSHLFFKESYWQSKNYNEYICLFYCNDAPLKKFLRGKTQIALNFEQKSIGLNLEPSQRNFFFSNCAICVHQFCLVNNEDT